MKEGKRMFSIFAARMFEQRVLEAYREKIEHQRMEEAKRMISIFAASMFEQRVLKAYREETVA